jgi:hypothetical protein
MLRKYNISITTSKNAPQIADNILRNFDCCISDPSVWLTPAPGNGMGLTFLNKTGSQLDSAIFKNQAFFNPDHLPVNSEAQMIAKLVYSNLYEHYRFEQKDIKVSVTAGK